MDKPTYDTASLTKVVEQADAVFRECRVVLQADVKQFDLQKLLEMQGRLGRALYFLEHQIIGFKRKKREIIAGKKDASLEDFKSQLSRMNEHIRAAESAIDYGKAIGDAYAWLFVGTDQTLLRRHYDHQRQKHLPVGIGGIGEIEFISKFPRWGKFLAIHHGITTFLRIGDVSFVNVATGKIDGIAELKSKMSSKEQMTVSVSYIGKKLPLQSMPAPVDVGVTEAKPADSAWFKKRLQRQEDEIRSSLFPAKKSALKLVEFTDAQVIFDPQPLVALFDNASVDTASVSQISAGVALVGIKLPASSLVERVMNTQPFDAFSILRNLGAEATKLMLAGSTDNALQIGWLVFPSDGRYQLNFGATPLLWWPIRRDVIEAIASGGFIVKVLFNPAHMIAALTKNGFVVQKRHPVYGFELQMQTSDGYVATLKNADYFFNLVSQQLISEVSVVDLLTSLVTDLDRKKIRGRINLEMVYKDAINRRPKNQGAGS